MRENIYENIMKNSRIAYLKINCKKSENGKYIGVNIIDQSEEFEKKVKILTDIDILNKEKIESEINKWISYKFKNDEFDLFIKDTIEKGCNIVKYPLQLKDKALIVDIYYVGNYFIVIYNFKQDKIVFEKNMEQNEDNFREITKYCDSVFIIKDDKRATYVSPAFKHVFEADSDKLYKDINKLYDYFKKDGCNNQYEINEFDFDKSNEGTGKVILDNNKEKWIWYKFLPIKDSQGNITKRVGILTDVTEKQKIEEEKNKLKLDFFANLSHDLRTPINLISSTIQLIKMNLNKLSQEESQKLYKYMNIMEMNSFRLVRLINNLLDSTKIDAGFVQFNPINADIIQFVEDICDSVVEFIKSNKMDLIFDTNIEEEIVSFDPELLERIILNILSNAIKFNKVDGTIFVNINSVEDKINITIKDEGIGIPKEKIDIIFERFEQVHTKNRIEKQGTGIGLYLVKSLVELHGGSININSEVNRGSEFVITLPKKTLNLNESFMTNNKEIRHINANIEFSDI